MSQHTERVHNMNMDFSRLTIKDVEELVGKKADSAEVKNGWIELLFATDKGASMHVSFQKW